MSIRFTHRSISRTVLLALVLPTVAAAQALPNLALARVRYNTLKTTAKPDGDLRLQIEQIDRAIADAVRLGRDGEARRLLFKGTALLNGQPWTDADDYRHSLTLRADRLFADSSVRYAVRLEQIYQSSMTLTSPRTATASLRALLAQPQGAPESIPLATVDAVPRDLAETPLAMAFDLSKVANGPYELVVEVRDAQQPLGRATLRVAVQKDLAARTAALEAAAGSAPPSVQPDIRYPLDVIRKVDRGLVEMGNFDLARELAGAEAVAASARGRDPFVGRTGDFERHYVLEAAGEIMPYRVYVPTRYDAKAATPLVIALHGLGATEDSFFDSYQRLPPRLAEQHGFLLAAPLGFRVDGFYGARASRVADPAADERASLSEQDVMQVLKRMRTDYTVDPDRIYLIGHSMGAIGTWALGAKYPDVWAALGPFSGMGLPASVARMRHIPEIVVHGDTDPTVNVAGSRAMVAEMRRLGVDVTYIEVAGGNHLDVVVPNLPKVFEFLASKRRVPAER
jgi:poly(3-hydroxybutyrate) depolymerase